MANTSSTNIPILSVGKTIDILSNAYIGILNQGLSAGSLPSVMMWGAPGVGKSQAVKQIGKRIEKESGKKVNIIDVRLILFNPIDLRGIPVANEDRSLAVWLKPLIFQMDDSEDVVNILFLDEISAAPQSVQAAAYQITLDRIIGEHKLPDNCIVIAAGNRVTDKSVAYKMPKALANRLLHLEIIGSFTSWRNWAIRSGINRKVIGYLSFRNDRLYGFDATNDDLAFPTPRTWELVSDVLNRVNEDVKQIYPLVAGLIGAGPAIEFRSWCEVYGELPTMDEVFNGTVTDVPKKTDTLYALASSMTAYAIEHKYDSVKIGNSIKYAERFPADFLKLLITNYYDIADDYKEFLMTLPEYVSSIQKGGQLRNGYVE